MATTAPVADPKTSPKPTLIPPEEKFWKRYSPHNEAPLSGVSSTLLHVLIFGLLLGIIWLQDKLKVGEESRPVSVDPVRFSKNPGDPGGGGSKTGKDKGSGANTGDDEPERGEDDDRKISPEPPKHEPLDPVKKEGITTEFKDDPTGKILLQQGTETFNKLA